MLKYKNYNFRRVEFLRSYTKKGDVVIFSANPLMEHAGPLFFDRIYIVSKNRGKDINEILKSLKEKGVTYCYYWNMNKNFTKRFLENKDYKLTEFTFSVNKRLPKQYLVKIEM